MLSYNQRWSHQPNTSEQAKLLHSITCQSWFRKMYMGVHTKFTIWQLLSYCKFCIHTSNCRFKNHSLTIDTQLYTQKVRLPMLSVLWSYFWALFFVHSSWPPPHFDMVFFLRLTWTQIGEVYFIFWQAMIFIFSRSLFQKIICLYVYFLLGDLIF